MNLLSPEAIRVLGCLLEKAVTTPDYYPLTLNSLLTACNQKSSRDPVVDYDDETVVRALDELREQQIAWQTLTPGSRTAKYRHELRKILPLTDAEEAVLCCLLLRGPQTVGEIKTRCARSFAFDSLEDAAATLQALADRDEPIVVELPRQPGRKDCRWAQLLGGPPEIADSAETIAMEPARARVAAADQRIQDLENETNALRQELDALRGEFDAFRNELLG